MLILTEHGLTPENLQNTRIPGYNLIGGFSRQHHNKGGIAIYGTVKIQQRITVTSISDTSTELICETILVKIKMKRRNIHLLGVYRPPNSNLETALDLLSFELNRIPSASDHILMVGDVNIDNLVEDNKKTSLDNMLHSHGLRRLSLPPTRITSNTQTSIDCICTNKEELVLSTQVLNTGLSDHTAQLFSVSTEMESHSPTESKRRCFNEKTVEELRLRLQEQDWSNVILEENVEAAYNMFSNILHITIEITCPHKPAKQKKTAMKNIWDAESQALKISYIEALNKELITGHPDDKKETARRKKTYDTKLKTLRKQTNINFIERSDNKSKAIWNIINGERKEKPTKTHLKELKIRNEIIKSPEEIANHMNSFFATVADNTLSHNKSLKLVQTITRVNNPPITQKLSFSTTNENEILHIINTLKPKTSAGDDEFSAKVIKQCKNEIVTPLTNIINKSLTQGKFPNKLKLSKIYPKYKSGPTNDVTSYRPISLTSTFSKILERVALTRLLTHLNHNQLLTARQHGFIKNRSTTTAIAQLIETIIDRLEEGKIATSIFLDFSKAFDCIDHKLITTKLQSLGVIGKELDWFTSYLENRKQLVEITYTINNSIQKVKSGQLPTSRGVPQGSVLGPILYILLTNDFPSYLEKLCEMVMYADDTALVIANKKKDLLDFNSSAAFNTAKQYCLLNELVLNTSKTQQIIHTPSRNNLEGLPEITTVYSGKYLGIIVDQNLSWGPHIDKLCSKLNSSLYVVRRIKLATNTQVALTAYYSLFESHLRYGVIAWGGTTATNLQRVLIIQKRAVRTLKGLRPLETCRIAFKELGILTIVGLYIQEIILYAIRTGKTRTGDVHSYNTRHGRNFLLDRHRLTLTEKKPSYRGALFFNTLPDHIRQLPEKNFKTSLKAWLLERPMYNITEFLQWRTQNT